MTKQQIEAWALRMVDRVSKNEPHEDAFEEAKATWVPAPQAARRIAGLCNAAGQEPVLWVIGLDEKSGAVGAAAKDFATWWGQVSSQFDGLAPDHVVLNVPTGDTTVVAIAFDTTRAPYIVRNPVYGQPGAGPVEREVPWRDATGVRSAKREEILRILVPLQMMPDVEVLSATVRALKADAILLDGVSRRIQVRIEMYVTPRAKERVVIPAHKTSLRVRFAELAADFGDVEFARVPAGMIGVTSAEAIIDGPGILGVSGSGHFKTPPEFSKNPALFELDLGMVGLTTTIQIRHPCPYGYDDPIGASVWGEYRT
jgi:hypothetical protein